MAGFVFVSIPQVSASRSKRGWLNGVAFLPCSDAGAGSGGERRGRNHFRARLSVRLIDYECALLPVLLPFQLMLGLCSHWRAAVLLWVCYIALLPRTWREGHA